MNSRKFDPESQVFWADPACHSIGSLVLENENPVPTPDLRTPRMAVSGYTMVRRPELAAVSHDPLAAGEMGPRRDKNPVSRCLLTSWNMRPENDIIYTSIDRPQIAKRCKKYL